MGRRGFAGGRSDADIRNGTAGRANINTGNIITGSVNVNRSGAVNGYGGYGIMDTAGEQRLEAQPQAFRNIDPREIKKPL